MDLGTVKSKLDNGLYVSIDGFVYEMRLTFSNAMTYNPPSDDVHIMAKNVSDVFEAMLKLLWNPHPSNEVDRMARQMGGEVWDQVEAF